MSERIAFGDTASREISQGAIYPQVGALTGLSQRAISLGMKLKIYIAKNRLTQSEFAAKVGAEQSSVSEWLSGRKRPSWDMLERIAAATGGKVTPNDFLPASPEDEKDSGPLASRAA